MQSYIILVQDEINSDSIVICNYYTCTFYCMELELFDMLIKLNQELSWNTNWIMTIFTCHNIILDSSSTTIDSLMIFRYCYLVLLQLYMQDISVHEHY